MPQECRCYIKTIEDSAEDGDGEYKIVQCPLCKAAPDLLEACKGSKDSLHKILGMFPVETIGGRAVALTIEKLEIAIAKAKEEE